MDKKCRETTEALFPLKELLRHFALFAVEVGGGVGGDRVEGAVATSTPQRRDLTKSHSSNLEPHKVPQTCLQPLKNFSIGKQID